MCGKGSDLETVTNKATTSVFWTRRLIEEMYPMMHKRRTPRLGRPLNCRQTLSESCADYVRTMLSLGLDAKINNVVLGLPMLINNTSDEQFRKQLLAEPQNSPGKRRWRLPTSTMTHGDHSCDAAKAVIRKEGICDTPVHPVIKRIKKLC